MAITEKVDKLHQAVAWRGDLPITSRYSAGIAGERFFRAIKDEARFLGTRCEACDLVYVPATIFCERCFAELDEWVEVPSTGARIHLHRALPRPGRPAAGRAARHWPTSNWTAAMVGWCTISARPKRTWSTSAWRWRRCSRMPPSGKGRSWMSSTFGRWRTSTSPMRLQ